MKRWNVGRISRRQGVCRVVTLDVPGEEQGCRDAGCRDAGMQAAVGVGGWNGKREPEGKCSARILGATGGLEWRKARLCLPEGDIPPQREERPREEPGHRTLPRRLRDRPGQRPWGPRRWREGVGFL